MSRRQIIASIQAVFCDLPRDLADTVCQIIGSPDSIFDSADVTFRITRFFARPGTNLRRALGCFSETLVQPLCRTDCDYGRNQASFLRSRMHPRQLVGSRIEAPDRQPLLRALRPFHGQEITRGTDSKQRGNRRSENRDPRSVRIRIPRPQAAGGHERISSGGPTARQAPRFSAGTRARVLLRSSPKADSHR